IRDAEATAAKVTSISTTSAASLFIELLERAVRSLHTILQSPLGKAGIADQGAAHRIVQFVNLTIQELASYMRSVAKKFSKAIIVNGETAALTRVEVTIEGRAVAGVEGGRCHLFVDGFYEAPARPRHTSRYLAGVEAEKFVYGHELPLMLKGSIRVGIAYWD